MARKKLCRIVWVSNEVFFFIFSGVMVGRHPVVAEDKRTLGLFGSA